jgi:hypothetical protein
MKSKLLEKLAIQIMVVLVGIGGFWAGMYYSMEKLSQEIEKWSSEYEQVSSNLSLYMEVADPQTVRFYVKELNKILDDITFLNNLVKSGQLADESLVVYASMVEDVDDRLIMLRKEMYEELESLRLSITVKTDDKVYGLKEDVVTGRKAVLSKLNDLNSQLDMFQRKLEKTNTDVQTVKDSKYGKKIWSEK